MANEPLKVEFKVASCRKIPNPYHADGNDDNLGKQQLFEVIADVRDIPDNFPMETNPREQNLNTKVSKRIRSTLLGTDSDFYLLNRGILLSAKEVNFNAYTKVLSVVFEDFKVHGNVDGGHTYKVILENRGSIDSNITQYVKIEILTGVEDIYQDLAEARNTSTQVKDTSIGNLKGCFDIIKNCLKDQPYSENISYYENDEGEIAIAEILAILNMFNIDRYKVEENKDFPTVSYNANRTCRDYYLTEIEGKDQSKNPYVKMLPIMVDIFKLYDQLECNMANYYKQTTPGGKYGLIKGVVTTKNGKCYKSKFYQKDIYHQTAKGLLYPIIAAFRALVEERDGKYSWICSPFDVMKDKGPTLVSSIIERLRANGNNPNAVGKDTQQWRTLFQVVKIEQQQALIQKLMNR